MLYRILSVLWFSAVWDHGLALSVLCWTRLAHGRYQTATVGIRFMLLVPVRKTVCSAFELYSYRTIAESYQTATVGIRFMLLVPVRNTVCSAFELYSYSTSWVISDGRVFSKTVGIRFFIQYLFGFGKQHVQHLSYTRTVIAESFLMVVFNETTGMAQWFSGYSPTVTILLAPEPIWSSGGFHVVTLWWVPRGYQLFRDGMVGNSWLSAV